jgi:hypothetical protein
VTYYTIPFKSDGTCCPECQPDPSTCSCEEEGCCDPQLWVGKTVVFTFNAESFGYGGILFPGSDLFTEYVSWTGPMSGLSAIGFDWRQSCINSSPRVCYSEPGICQRPISGSFEAQFGYSCHTDGVDGSVYYVPRLFGGSVINFSGSSYYYASLLPNCGGEACHNSDDENNPNVSYAFTCSSLYQSSCFSASCTYTSCVTTFLGLNCPADSVIGTRWQIVTWSVTIS